MKEFEFKIPKGYEVDTNRFITWDDIIADNPNLNGFIDNINIMRAMLPSDLVDKWVAEYKVNILMPYYGGKITDKEWEDRMTTKHILSNVDGSISVRDTKREKYFLAFRTEHHRAMFLENNASIVADCLGVK